MTFPDLQRYIQYFLFSLIFLLLLFLGLTEQCELIQLEFQLIFNNSLFIEQYKKNNESSKRMESF